MEFVNRNGKRIFYEVINESSDMGVIVFLNGVMASTNSWIKQYDLFKKIGYKIVLHDFVGQLRSDKFSGVYSFQKHAEDVSDLLLFLNVKHSHLIGTSYGGEVAMKYAIMYPRKVDSISVIDSVTELDEQLIKTLEEWIDLANTHNGELFFNGMMSSIYGETYIKNNKELLAKRAKGMNSIPNDYFDGQVGLYQTFIQDVYMTDILDKIVCPSLIIVGEKDTLKPIKYSQLIVKHIRNSKLVIIPDSGHVTIIEKPNELNVELVSFIQGVKTI